MSRFTPRLVKVERVHGESERVSGKREKSNGTWLKLHSAYGHEIYDTFGAKSHQQLRWSIIIIIFSTTIIIGSI